MHRQVKMRTVWGPRLAYNARVDLQAPGSQYQVEMAALLASTSLGGGHRLGAPFFAAFVHYYLRNMP